MRFICWILLFIYYGICYSDDMEKYRLLGEQCSYTPTNPECLQLKSKFLQLIQKCQTIQTQQQFIVCQEIKLKLCAVFPTYCLTQTTTTSTTLRTTTKAKVKKAKPKPKPKPKSKPKPKPKSKPKVTKSSSSTTSTTPRKKIIKAKTSSSTTTTTKLTTISETITNEEFVKVPLDPDVLRTRGEYCVRHGKEKRCHDLLNNLKTAYSSCSKKKPEKSSIKSEEIDCHSFESHMCKAFPKFPPCIKKIPKLI